MPNQFKRADYYILECESKYPVWSINENPDIIGPCWMDGEKIDFPLPDILKYTLDEVKEPSNLKSLYSNEAIPLMRKDLALTLIKNGVENLEIFNALLIDTQTGNTFTEYFSFNLVNNIQALSLDENGKTYIDIEKTNGRLLFRLEENISAIPIHKDLKKILQNNDFNDLLFYEIAYWAG